MHGSKVKQSSRMRWLFSVASILSIVAFPLNPLVIFEVLEAGTIKMLWYIGWIIWTVGMTLVILPYYYLYLRRVKILIDGGVYSIVRHPLYLGWILGIFVATVFLYQHWLFVLIGVPGIATVYLISKEEEQHNVERFGDAYEHYMAKVPRMNLLMGLVRLFRR